MPSVDLNPGLYYSGSPACSSPHIFLLTKKIPSRHLKSGGKSPTAPLQLHDGFFLRIQLGRSAFQSLAQVSKLQRHVIHIRVMLGHAR